MGKTRQAQYDLGLDKVMLLSSAILIMAVAALFLFFWATWGPYLQMRYYIHIKGAWLSISEFVQKLDKAFKPYNYVQERIRMDILKEMPNFPPEKDIGNLVSKVMLAVDELIEREPYEPRYSMNAGQVLENIGLYEKAEVYYRKALALVPNRPDLLYLLAQNLVVQGKLDQAQEPLEKLLKLFKEDQIPKAGILYGAALFYAPEEYMAEKFEILQEALAIPNTIERLGSSLPVMRLMYNDFLFEFTKNKDEENFLKALDTAIRLEEFWEKNKEEEFRRGKIKELPWKNEEEKKSEIYKRIKKEFPERGWGVVDIREE